MLNEIREKVKPWIESSARPFARIGLSPNHITVIALMVGILAGLLFSVEETFWAGLVVLLGGFFDVIDGAVARITGKVTQFGGVLDSVFDRITDAALYLGVAIGGLGSLAGEPDWLLPFMALIGSYLVSYVRARAESEGVKKLDVGIAERAERLLILAVGALMNLIAYALAAILILTIITIVQRVWAAHRLLAPTAN